MSLLFLYFKMDFIFVYNQHNDTIRAMNLNEYFPLELDS